MNLPSKLFQKDREQCDVLSVLIMMTASTLRKQQFPAGVMVWGCFSGEKGSGGLYSLDKNVTLNVAVHVNVLEDHMLPFYESHENSYFLLQDSALCHRAKGVKVVNREQGSGN